MASSGNRVIKQKTEKAKKYQRESRKAREIGLSTPEEYRKSAVNITERPKKAEREATAAADAAGLAEKDKTFVAKNAGKTPKPLEIKKSDEEPSGGHQDVTPAVKKRAIRAQQERALGMGTAQVSSSGDIVPLSGRDASAARASIAANDKELLKGAAKRAQVREDKAVKISADQLTPEQKKDRNERRLKKAEKQKKINAAKPVAKLPAAEAKGAPRANTGKKNAAGKWVRTDGPSQMPGEGKTGILNMGDIATPAGELSSKRRRKIERKAAYNVKNMNKTKGYAGAAKLGTRTSSVINAKNETASQKTDLRARKKAASIDSKRDALKKSLLAKASKVEGPEKAKIEATAHSIIREPQKADGSRPGPTRTVTVDDERDLTKRYTREVPVGAPRKVERTSAMKGRIQMNRTGEVAHQPDVPKETPIGVMGSHEDRLHALTKWMRVPVEGKAGGTDLEPVHLRSYMKHLSQKRNVRYNEQGMTSALFEAKHKHPEMFNKIHQEALQHRTKRIGQVNEQRERAASKAKEKRMMEKESRGGKRATPKALNIISNVAGKSFTELKNGKPKA